MSRFSARRTPGEGAPVPVALVQASWGGTHVEAWSSPAALGQCPGTGTTDNGTDDTTRGGGALAACANPPVSADAQGHNNCSVLFNAMVHPALPAERRAVLWCVR